MLLPIKAICPKGKVRADGTCLVFVQYCYSATQRTLLNTEISIPYNYWNKKDRCISDKLPNEIGDHETLNKELLRQLRIAQDLVIYTTENKISAKGAFVKNSFKPSLDTSSFTVEVKKEVAKVEKEKRSKLDLYWCCLSPGLFHP